MYSFKTFSTTDKLYLRSLLLRYKILRIPLGLEFNETDFLQDEKDTHISIFKEDMLLGTLTISEKEGDLVKMRQVAVTESEQRKGIGKVLVQYAEEFCRKRNYSKIFCHARDSALPFYLSLGYQIKGEKFEEVGIDHFYLEKILH